MKLTPLTILCLLSLSSAITPSARANDYQDCYWAGLNRFNSIVGPNGQNPKAHTIGCRAVFRMRGKTPACSNGLKQVAIDLGCYRNTI